MGVGVHPAQGVGVGVGVGPGGVGVGGIGQGAPIMLPESVQSAQPSKRAGTQLPSMDGFPHSRLTATDSPESTQASGQVRVTWKSRSGKLGKPMMSTLGAAQPPGLRSTDWSWRWLPDCVTKKCRSLAATPVSLVNVAVRAVGDGVGVGVGVGVSAGVGVGVGVQPAHGVVVGDGVGLGVGVGVGVQAAHGVGVGDGVGLGVGVGVVVGVGVGAGVVLVGPGVGVGAPAQSR